MKIKNIPEPRFPELFKEIREKLDKTQDQMSKIYEVDLRTYQRWESGERDPGGKYVYKLLFLKYQLDGRCF